VLEATTASDLAGVEDSSRVCVQGEGAVLSFMDNSTIYDKDVFKLALALSKEKGISTQVKTAVAGGNDSGIIHKSGYGVKAAAISAPCRYIHSQSNMLKKSDVTACYELAKALSETEMLETLGRLMLVMEEHPSKALEGTWVIFVLLRSALMRDVHPAKASSPMVVRLSGNSISERLMHPANARFPILYVQGIIIVLSAVQPSKVLFPISAPLGIAMLSRLVHPAKALSLIVNDAVSARITVLSPVQFIKAPSYMFDILVRSTSLSDMQLIKAFSSI
jgi:hypothetical protein